MKTWFITGCSSGIGRGIANAVLEKGYNAVVTARNISNVADIVENYPETAIALKLDLCDRQGMKDAVDMAIQRFGAVDVLVNNAGHGYRAAVEEGEDDAVAELFQTNFFGPVQLIKLLLPQMRQRKSGTIINISSIAAVSSAVGSGYYAASKAALELMSNALSRELKEHGIRVIIVEPGSFRTNFYGTSLKGSNIRIDDYANTAGKTRKENITVRCDQPGDPYKAGRVIVEIAESEKFPRRLLLGSDAVKVVSKELERRIKEVQDWKYISENTDFDI